MKVAERLVEVPSFVLVLPFARMRMFESVSGFHSKRMLPFQPLLRERLLELAFEKVRFDSL